MGFGLGFGGVSGVPLAGETFGVPLAGGRVVVPLANEREAVSLAFFGLVSDDILSAMRRLNVKIS